MNQVIFSLVVGLGDMGLYIGNDLSSRLMHQ